MLLSTVEQDVVEYEEYQRSKQEEHVKRAVCQKGTTRVKTKRTNQTFSNFFLSTEFATVLGKYVWFVVRWVFFYLE